MSPWVLSDIQSLDVNIANTKDWLKQSLADQKDLNRVYRIQLSKYRKTDFRVYSKLELIYDTMIPSLKSIKKSLLKQSKIRFELEKKNKLNIFKNNSDSIKFFSSDSIMISDLQSNSLIIIKQKVTYEKSKLELIDLFKKNGYNLFFIKNHSNSILQRANILKILRNKLLDKKYNFDSFVNELLFSNSKSKYSKEIISNSVKVMNLYQELDKHEKYFNNIYKISYREIKKRVYIIPLEKKSLYERNSEKRIVNYRKLLKEINILLEI